MAHNITPGRGGLRSKLYFISDVYELRASECNGLVPMGSVKDPESTGGKLEAHWRKCVLCKKYTNTFCLGCKWFLCLDKDRAQELTSLYSEMEGVDPLSKNVFAFKQRKIDEASGKSSNVAIHAIRSCYHIVHEIVLNQHLTEKAKAPGFLSRVLEPEERLPCKGLSKK